MYAQSTPYAAENVTRAIAETVAVLNDVDSRLQALKIGLAQAVPQLAPAILARDPHLAARMATPFGNVSPFVSPFATPFATPFAQPPFGAPLAPQFAPQFGAPIGTPLVSPFQSLGLSPYASLNPLAAQAWSPISPLGGLGRF